MTRITHYTRHTLAVIVIVLLLFLFILPQGAASPDSPTTETTTTHETNRTVTQTQSNATATVATTATQSGRGVAQCIDLGIIEIGCDDSGGGSDDDSGTDDDGGDESTPTVTPTDPPPTPTETPTTTPTTERDTPTETPTQAPTETTTERETETETHTKTIAAPPQTQTRIQVPTDSPTQSTRVPTSSPTTPPTQTRTQTVTEVQSETEPTERTRDETTQTLHETQTPTQARKTPAASSQKTSTGPAESDRTTNTARTESTTRTTDRPRQETETTETTISTSQESETETSTNTSTSRQQHGGPDTNEHSNTTENANTSVGDQTESITRFLSEGRLPLIDLQPNFVLVGLLLSGVTGVILWNVKERFLSQSPVSQYELFDQLYDRVRRFWVGIAGYRRWGDEDVLDNPIRLRIYDLIGPYPGHTLTHIEEEMDISRSTIEHHAKLLLRDAPVDREQRNGNQYYFIMHENTPTKSNKNENASYSTADRLRWMLTDEQFGVLVTIDAHDEISADDLVAVRDCTPQTMSEQLAALEEKDLIIRTDSENDTYVSLAAVIEE